MAAGRGAFLLFAHLVSDARSVRLAFYLLDSVGDDLQYGSFVPDGTEGDDNG